MPDLTRWACQGCGLTFPFPQPFACPNCDRACRPPEVTIPDRFAVDTAIATLELLRDSFARLVMPEDYRIIMANAAIDGLESLRATNETPETEAPNPRPEE